MDVCSYVSCTSLCVCVYVRMHARLDGRTDGYASYLLAASVCSNLVLLC